MKMSVGTGAAVKVDTSNYPDIADKGQRLVLQNLGPGDIEWDTRPNVVVGQGVKLAAGGDWDMLLVGPVYVTASAANTDLRYSVTG